MKKYLLLFTVSFVMYLMAGFSSSDAQSLGTQELEFIIPGTERHVVAEVYYPTEGKKDSKEVDHGIWKRRSYIKDAPLASQGIPYPLVIFSHGWQGDRFGNSWIAEALVDAGYVVVMIDHAHDNSYEHSDEFVYTSLWQRPLDLSALLDYLLKDPKWSQAIDKSRIAAGGFSFGGLTSLWLAGIEGDAKAYKEAMESEARWSDWPQSVKDRASKVDWTKAAKSYYDSRVKAVFSIAPALGKGFQPQGIQQAKVPILIIVGDKDRITPPDINADFFYSHLKNADLMTIKGAEHFTFMNSCSALGEAITPHLCQETPAISRFKAHKEAADKLIAFLKEKLNITNAQKAL